MNLPSIKTLERAFPGKGKALRNLLEHGAPVNAHPAVIEWERQCYARPTFKDRRMCALNAEAGTYGVEAVWHAGEGPSQCIGNPAFEYLNTGDTYALTIVRMAGGRYIVASWGDLVERGDYE